MFFMSKGKKTNFLSEEARHGLGDHRACNRKLGGKGTLGIGDWELEGNWDVAGDREALTGRVGFQAGRKENNIRRVNRRM